MKVKDLRARLQGNAGSAGNAAPSLVALDDMLTPLDDLSVDELCGAIKPTVAKLAKSIEAKKKKSQSLNQDGITRYAVELTDTKDDNAAFEAVVKRIEKDRSIKIAEAKEIAARFTGEALKYKTKRDALKAILQRQIADKRGTARGAQVSDLF